jgi:primosomal protein N' (replication factor Y)
MAILNQFPKLNTEFIMKTPTYSIAKIALNRPFYHTLDYRIPDDLSSEHLKIGTRIKIPFGSRTEVGILWKKAKESLISPKKLKAFIKPIDKTPIFSDTLLSICRFASNYYHHPIGEVLFCALPSLLRQGHSITNDIVTPSCESMIINSPKFHLNEAQASAVSIITQSLNQFKPYMLLGVTGSGKTEVYFQAISRVLQNHQQALVLIPEISLTPQTLRRFKERFKCLVRSVHSGMTPKERLTVWQEARTGEARIIIGTRSASFTPFYNLGIIVIDEEHDLSFKQQEGFRYSARDLSILRAQLDNIPILLGSATPSFETLQNVKQKGFTLLSLPERAGNAKIPNYRVIDIRSAPVKHGLSIQLLETIKTHLDNNQQILLFLNRRGYAPTLMCPQCGWIAQCRRCTTNFVLHKMHQQLRCHHCDTVKLIPTACPICSHKRLQQIGVGTERLEHGLKKLFPNIPILRIDRDTTRKKQSLARLLENAQNHKKQILLGTQMLAKGHHFPQVTLVGVINFDASFFSSDFRTPEHMAQLLIQVTGRTGRTEKSSEVIIQTHYPHHPLLQTLLKKGYIAFAKKSLLIRKESRLPPYTFLAIFRAAALKPELAKTFLNTIKKLGETIQSTHFIKLLGPVPAPIEKKRSYFRMQLLIQATSRRERESFLSTLMPKVLALKTTKKVRWSIDIDPMEMY